MIKAVFLDMDGTVISHKQGKVLESTKDAICQLRERGIKVFAATGRHILEMEELPVKGISFDGYVMLNGQICLDGEKQLVYDFPIAAEDTKRMIAVFEEKKIPVMLVGQNRMYINFVDEKVRAAQKAISTAVPKVGSYNGENVYQFIVYDSEGKVQQLMENLTDCKENVWNLTLFRKEEERLPVSGRYWSILRLDKRKSWHLETETMTSICFGMRTLELLWEMPVRM
jgi:hydroxymethylpyrimidine pyrophosphatase-like HAD family hydrolase